MATYISSSELRIVSTTGHIIIKDMYSNKTVILQSLNSLGELVLEPEAGQSIFELADFVSACFDAKHLFGNITSVTFTFNSKTVTITRNDPYKYSYCIHRKWEKSEP